MLADLNLLTGQTDRHKLQSTTAKNKKSKLKRQEVSINLLPALAKQTKR